MNTEELQEALRHQVSFHNSTRKPDNSNPASVMRRTSRLYSDKNDDWADSWRVAGQIIELMANGESIELESAEDFTSMALYWQRLVKLQRSFNGEFLTDGELNFEAASDSLDDGICYAAMHRANTEVKND